MPLGPPPACWPSPVRATVCDRGAVHTCPVQCGSHRPHVTVEHPKCMVLSSFYVFVDSCRFI